MNLMVRKLVAGSPPEDYVFPPPGPIVVGRGAECGIRAESPATSRRHCAFVYRLGRWHIDDLCSTNGTRLNGDPVWRAELSDGDAILAGGAELRVTIPVPAGSEHPADAESDRVLAGTGPEPGSRTQRVAAVAEPAGQIVQASRLLGRRYELCELVHQGSTGVFYRAKDTKDRQWVCVKVLSQSVAGDADELKRFVRGVRAAAKLQHPNVVQLYRAGQSGHRQWWLAMEYVDGSSLRQVLSRYGVGNMLSPKKVLAIARDIVAALEVAYERQVLHRNINPDNILLTKAGVAKLGNFSLARGVVLTTLQRITATSELVGDLAFMGPERTEAGAAVDCRSDIYALGACLYQLLSGRPPFAGRGMVDLVERIRNEPPAPISRVNLSVPGPLEGVVLKCLAKSPTDRFQSPMQLREELARVAKFQGLAT